MGVSLFPKSLTETELAGTFICIADLDEWSMENDALDSEEEAKREDQWLINSFHSNNSAHSLRRYSIRCIRPCLCNRLRLLHIMSHNTFFSWIFKYMSSWVP